MKKIFISTFMLLFAVCSAYAFNYADAYNQLDSKPAVMLVTAPWVNDTQTYVTQLQYLQNDYGNRANIFVQDISDKSTALYNEMFPIYQRLPYVMLLKSSGKITRVLPRNCAADYSCLNDKVKIFIE